MGASSYKHHSIMHTLRIAAKVRIQMQFMAAAQQAGAELLVTVELQT